jgi:hypothetical protein
MGTLSKLVLGWNLANAGWMAGLKTEWLERAPGLSRQHQGLPAGRWEEFFNMYALESEPRLPVIFAFNAGEQGVIVESMPTQDAKVTTTNNSVTTV